MNLIILTGRVLEWDYHETDDHRIPSEEAAIYEQRGYDVFTLGGDTYASKELKPRDGDIQIQPKSDMVGRMMQAGGHSNFGYSGYFKGFVYLNGDRKKLVDFWTLFPSGGHHYAAQKDIPEVVKTIRDIINRYVGKPVTKIKGGYAFDPAYKAGKS